MVSRITCSPLWPGGGSLEFLWPGTLPGLWLCLSRSESENQGWAFLCLSGPFLQQTPNKEMWGSRDAYCAAWGCESTGIIWWEAPVNTDLITVGQRDRNIIGANICQANGAWVDCGPFYDKRCFPNHLWVTVGVITTPWWLGSPLWDKRLTGLWVRLVSPSVPYSDHLHHLEYPDPTKDQP